MFDEYYKLYLDSFWVYRRNNFNMAKTYCVLGLMRCEKNHTNMERMSEFDQENDYRYYHFLSESKWSWNNVSWITSSNASIVLIEQKSKNDLPVSR